MSTTIVVLHGDQTGEELLHEALRLLSVPALAAHLNLVHFDLSLASRRRSDNEVVHEAAREMRKCGFGLKAATITPEVQGDVGSPNALLRAEVNGKVILRTGNHIPGVAAVGATSAPMSVVRMAVDDAYGAREWRKKEGDDEIAFRTEQISRATCRAVAEFSFRHAQTIGGTVFGGPKYTVSPVYEGLLKEEMDGAARRHPDVPYNPQLIDTTYAMLLMHDGGPLVVPALNRDGDCLSDFVLQLYGTIAGSESVLLGFGEDMAQPTVVMAEAPHGTAPSLEGRDIANPMAMFLAAAAVLRYSPEPALVEGGKKIHDEVFEAVRQGVRTLDIGGDAKTSEFTDVVLSRMVASRK